MLWCILFLFDSLLTFDHGHNSALLNSRRSLETVSIYTTEELGFESHSVEAVGGLIVV